VHFTSLVTVQNVSWKCDWPSGAFWISEFDIKKYLIYFGLWFLKKNLANIEKSGVKTGCDKNPKIKMKP
jgi:hypothetical protein